MTGAEEPLESDASAERLYRALFERVGVNRAQEVLNALLESPFFYRTDDRDLFAVLRRNRSTFEEFFRVCFGWDLHVDEHLARVIRGKTSNPALTPKQRQAFELTSRTEQVLFLLLLVFQEAEGERQKIDWQRTPTLRFVVSDYVQHVFDRYREAGMLDARGGERDLLEAMKALFRKLEHYRLLSRVPGSGAAREDFSDEGSRQALYDTLPGLRCYRAEAIETSGLRGLAPMPAEPEGGA